MAEQPAQFNRMQPNSAGRGRPPSALFIFVLALLVLALLLVGCGRKGPLYLLEPAPETEIDRAAPESPES